MMLSFPALSTRRFKEVTQTLLAGRYNRLASVTEAFISIIALDTHFHA